MNYRQELRMILKFPARLSEIGIGIKVKMRSKKITIELFLQEGIGSRGKLDYNS